VLELQTRLETLGRSPDFLDGIPGDIPPRQSDRKQGDNNTQPPASGAAATGAELTDFNRAAEAAKQDFYLVCYKQSPNGPNFTALNVARVIIGYPPSVLALSRLAFDSCFGLPWHCQQAELFDSCRLVRFKRNITNAHAQ
jgi:hypothetical protein